MGYSYKKLWKMLSERGMSKTMFKDNIGISSSTLAKLSSDKVVSMDVLAKICDKLDCKIEDIIEYRNEMREFMEGLKDDFKDCGYTIYIDKWPKCVFKLSDRQARVFLGIGDNKLKEMILKLEFIADEENRPNAGIIGTTKIEFYNTDYELVINGSFAVTELFIQEFLRLCNQV